MTAMYQVGDLDPTIYARQGFGTCDAPIDGGYVCTWDFGHAHPQHVAGNGRRVVAVWPVTP